MVHAHDHNGNKDLSRSGVSHVTEIEDDKQIVGTEQHIQRDHESLLRQNTQFSPPSSHRWHQQAQAASFPPRISNNKISSNRGSGGSTSMQAHQVIITVFMLQIHTTVNKNSSKCLIKNRILTQLT